MDDIKQRYQDLALKLRTLKVTLPSGFEFEYLLPTVGQYILFTKGKQTQDDVIEFLQGGFPEGLRVEDLAIEDFNKLSEVISNFFVAWRQGKLSQNGSPNTQEESQS